MTTESTTHLQPYEPLLMGWIVGGTMMLEGESGRGQQVDDNEQPPH
jgi:hypothetical protein